MSLAYTRRQIWGGGTHGHAAELARSMSVREGLTSRESSSTGARSGDDAAATRLQLPSRWMAAALSGHGSSASNKSSDVSDDTGASSLWKQKWAGMRLVDTVMLDDSGDVERWIFTAKTGHVTSKKRAQDRTKIAERFERFALANPRNKERFVALLIRACPPGRVCPEERIVLNEKALRKALLVGTQELLGASLQCYLRPQNGSNSFLRGRYHRGEDDLPCFSLSKISPLYRLSDPAGIFGSAGGTAMPSSEAPVLGDDAESARLRTETEGALTSLVAFLEPRLSKGDREGEQQMIQKCEGDFVIDDNGELWLTSLPSVTVAPSPKGGVETTGAPDLSADSSTCAAPGESCPSRGQGGGDSDSSGGMDGQTVMGSPVHMPPLAGSTATLRRAVAPLDGSDNTPLGSARHQPTSARSNGEPRALLTALGDSAQQRLQGSTEGELPTIPSTMLGARGTPGDHNSRLSGKHWQQGGTPIIENKGGVYVANVHASVLRGLCCWREVR